MQWTREKPTKPGWYAWRVSSESSIHAYLTFVYHNGDELVADMKAGYFEYIVPMSEVVDREWLGPLP